MVANDLENGHRRLGGSLLAAKRARSLCEAPSGDARVGIRLPVLIRQFIHTGRPGNRRVSDGTKLNVNG